MTLRLEKKQAGGGGLWGSSKPLSGPAVPGWPYLQRDLVDVIINCTGVQTRQFICSAGQNPLFIFAVKAAASFPWRVGNAGGNADREQYRGPKA